MTSFWRNNDVIIASYNRCVDSSPVVADSIDLIMAQIGHAHGMFTRFSRY